MSDHAVPQKKAAAPQPKPKSQAPAPKGKQPGSNNRPIPSKQPSRSASKLKPVLANRFAISERGRHPLARTVQASEDVELHVEFPDSTDLGSLEASVEGFYDVVSVLRLGPRHYEVLLRPRAALVEATRRVDGVPVRTQLALTPTRGEATIEPIPINLTVDPPTTDEHDFGTRPKTTANAVSQVLRAWEKVYDSRIDGLTTFNSQVHERDPEPKPSKLETLLKIAAEFALGSVTAGLGAGFVDGISESAALTEMGKVLLENTLSTFVTESIKAGMDEASKEQINRKTPDGMELSLASYFFATQLSTLRAAKEEHVNRVETSLMSLTEKLDTKRSGDGYRAAVELRERITNTQVTPWKLQYNQSVQAWLNLKATTALGTLAPTQRNGKTDEDPGVNLQKMLDVKGATRFPDPEDNTRMPNAPGVLHLELARLGSLPAFTISHARVAVENDAMLAPLRKPLGQLRIPVVVSYNEFPNLGTRQPGRTFVITRNEKGVISADDSSGLLRSFFNESDLETARRILALLDQQQVQPVRG